MPFDVFGHQPMAFGESMSADQAVLLFAGPNGWSEAGILSTQMMLNYSQPVMRIYDFGAVGEGIPAAQYFIIGRPQGQGNIGQIVGPKRVNYCFYMSFGDACGVKDNNFLVAVGSGCNSVGDVGEDGNFAFGVNNCVLTSFGFNVSAQDMLFSVNLPFMFISLSVPDEAGFNCVSDQIAGQSSTVSTQSVTTTTASLNSNGIGTAPTFNRPVLALAQ
jgi:hypothetical protein